jgi:NADH-ubiquinone oxidoreductase chain 2
MLLNCKINQLLVNAVTLRREFKNKIIRVFLFILLYYLQTSSRARDESGVIGIYQSIFHSKGYAGVVITYFLETSGGLSSYFLLGGLSSCFILLGSVFSYTNCGITSLDNGLFQSIITTYSFNLFIYIIASIILLLIGFNARRILGIPKWAEFKSYMLYFFFTSLSISTLISTTTLCSLSFFLGCGYFFLTSFVPAVSYSNAYSQKTQILRENKQKSGIYR